MGHWAKKCPSLKRKAKKSKKVWVKKDFLKGSRVDDNASTPPKDNGPSRGEGKDGAMIGPLQEPPNGEGVQAEV